jgi:UPF0755 protein
MKRLLMAGVLIVALTFGIHLIRASNGGAPDFATAIISSSSQEKLVEIPSGANGIQIARILTAAGVVKSSAAFFGVAVADTRSTSIAPGTHRLTIGISSRQALAQLLDSKRMPNLLNIFEGEWNSEIFSDLKGRGFSQQEIDAALAKVTLPAGYKSLEGMLFPAQYNFAKESTLPQIFQAMVDRFVTESKAAKLNVGLKGLSPQDLLIIASIIQAEGDTKDFPKISRVIRNRLAISMPLQLDSTVHYVKKTRGQVFLSTQATLTDSKYNTYKHYGLPPGPIGNPGRAAIDGAMAPAVGDWLFFITVSPGDTRFTKSNEEFLQWKSLYEKNLRAGAFEVKK